MHSPLNVRCTFVFRVISAYLLSSVCINICWVKMLFSSFSRIIQGVLTIELGHSWEYPQVKICFFKAFGNRVTQKDIQSSYWYSRLGKCCKNFSIACLIFKNIKHLCPDIYHYLVNTFTAIVDLSRFNNSCLKSPASTLVDLTFQLRALRSFSLNQLRNLSL